MNAHELAVAEGQAEARALLRGIDLLDPAAQGLVVLRAIRALLDDQAEADAEFRSEHDRLAAQE